MRGGARAGGGPAGLSSLPVPLSPPRASCLQASASCPTPCSRSCFWNSFANTSASKCFPDGPGSGLSHVQTPAPGSSRAQGGWWAGRWPGGLGAGPVPRPPSDRPGPHPGLPRQAPAHTQPSWPEPIPVTLSPPPPARPPQALPIWYSGGPPPPRTLRTQRGVSRPRSGFLPSLSSQLTLEAGCPGLLESGALSSIFWQLPSRSWVAAGGGGYRPPAWPPGLGVCTCTFISGEGP